MSDDPRQEEWAKLRREYLRQRTARGDKANLDTQEDQKDTIQIILARWIIISILAFLGILIAWPEFAAGMFWVVIWPFSFLVLYLVGITVVQAIQRLGKHLSALFKVYSPKVTRGAAAAVQISAVVVTASMLGLFVVAPIIITTIQGLNGAISSWHIDQARDLCENGSFERCRNAISGLRDNPAADPDIIYSLNQTACRRDVHAADHDWASACGDASSFAEASGDVPEAIRYVTDACRASFTESCVRLSTLAVTYAEASASLYTLCQDNFPRACAAARQNEAVSGSYCEQGDLDFCAHRLSEHAKLPEQLVTLEDWLERCELFASDSAQNDQRMCGSMEQVLSTCPSDNTGGGCSLRAEIDFARGSYLSRQIGDPDSHATALDYFIQACDQGHAQACREVGHAFADGIGTRPNPEREMAYIVRACGLGDQPSCRARSEYLLLLADQSQDESEALEKYVEACRLSRSPEPCEFVRMASLVGHALPGGSTQLVRDVQRLPGSSRSRQIFAEARLCEWSSAPACLLLGRRYEAGDGVPESPQEALIHFEAACRLVAQGRDGTLDGCIEGISLSQNSPRYVSTYIGLLTNACQIGSGEHCFQLGQVYFDGHLVTRDAEFAAEKWNAACELGVAQGCFSHARLLVSSDYVDHDYDLTSASALSACRLGLDEGCNLFVEIADQNALRITDEALEEFWRLYCLSELGDACSSPEVIFPENLDLAHRFAVVSCRQEIEGVCLTSGDRFVSQSLELAFELYEVGCWIGDIDNCGRIAALMDDGSIPNDRFQWDWLCQTGLGRACYEMYESFPGGIPEEQEIHDDPAEQYLIHACNLGYTPACLELPDTLAARIWRVGESSSASDGHFGLACPLEFQSLVECRDHVASITSWEDLEYADLSIVVSVQKYVISLCASGEADVCAVLAQSYFQSQEGVGGGVPYRAEVTQISYLACLFGGDPYCADFEEQYEMSVSDIEMPFRLDRQPIEDTVEGHATAFDRLCSTMSNSQDGFMGYQVDTDGDRSADSIVDVYRAAEVDELAGTIRLTEHQGEETGGSTYDFFMNISDVNISTLEEPPISFARLSQIVPGRLVFRCEAGNCINHDVIYWEDGEERQVSEASFYCRFPSRAAFHFERLQHLFSEETPTGPGSGI